MNTSADNLQQPQDGEQAGDQSKKQQDQAFLGGMNKRLESSIKAAEDQHKTYKKCREAVKQAEAMKNTDPHAVRPFMILNALAALVPSLYAKNPEIEIRPTPLANEGPRAEAWVNFAKTAEALLQVEFVTATRLKRRMKGALRSTLTTGIGWVKMAWQDDYKADPVLQNRMNDAQDNIARVDVLNQKLEEAGNDNDALLAELSLQANHIEDTLNGESELYIRKGLVVDRIQSEDIFVLDDSVLELGDYLQATAIAQRVWMTEDAYQETFGKAAPEKAKRFSGTKAEVLNSSDDDKKDKLVQVFEIWDKATQTVYAFASGADEYAREPYTPPLTGERFYPFFAVTFNELDGEYHPISDVEMLIDLQNEYTHLRTQENHLRKRNKPTYALSKQGDLSAGDANKLVTELNTGGMDAKWVAIDSPPNVPIAQAVQQMPPPQINQALFDPSRNARDVEMATRSGDAARGFINKAKTATEAEIMSMGMQSGVAERQDIMEEVMADMAKYALEIFVQAFSPEDVEVILGSDRGWQNLPIDTAFKHLNLDIKAGSMSKPNKFQERDQWMQLMPVIQQTVQQMAELTAQGQPGMAQALRKMLEETISRFDERIDLDEFIPDMPAPPPPQQPGMQQLPQDEMAMPEGQIDGAMIAQQLGNPNQQIPEGVM